MTTKFYEVRTIHPITPRHTDVSYVDIGGEIDATDAKGLAATLRAKGVLFSGQRIREVRTTAEGNVAVFPSRVPGGAHCLILRPLAEADLFFVFVGDDLIAGDDGNVYVGSDRASPELAPETYGYARSHTLYEFLTSGSMRPSFSDSPPETLTFVEAYYTDVIDSSKRARHVRIVGGFFVPAGSDFTA